MDKLVHDRVAEREAALSADAEARLRASKEREQMLERQLARVQEQLGRLQSSHEDTQTKIFDTSLKYGM